MNIVGEQYHLGELAGKKDLQEELTKLELRLKHDLTVRMGAIAAATIAIFAAIIKLL
jgi:hypothetical protein